MCAYSNRKPRSKKPRYNLPTRRDYTRPLTSYDRIDTSDNRLLLEILDRLDRIEKHCGLENAPETEENGGVSMSISPVASGAPWPAPLDEDPAQAVPSVVQDLVSRIGDKSSRSMIVSNVFCRLRQIGSRFFENDRCIQAIASAISEIESIQSPENIESLEDPVMPKELARKLIESKSFPRLRLSMI